MIPDLNLVGVRRVLKAAAIHVMGSLVRTFPSRPFAPIGSP